MLCGWYKWVRLDDALRCATRYGFSQGLRLRQIDMIDDCIVKSSATLTKMSRKIREVCIWAVRRMRRRSGQRIGGRREFVVIDESHFRHKRKKGLNGFVRIREI
ncbi:hypothetical protein WMY93_001955 [Mugilogobius chulae]|uniref:Transposase n=1 Tax=Mugilogobius chulae TaxID=88201 RepID=A0AAW0PVH1_9GOBI